MRVALDSFDGGLALLAGGGTSFLPSFFIFHMVRVLALSGGGLPVCVEAVVGSGFVSARAYDLGS